MADHECTEIEKLRKLDIKVDEIDKEIRGDKAYPGINGNLISIKSQLDALIKKQDNNKLWLRGSVLGFAVFILMLFYYGVTTFNTVEAIPTVYVTKAEMAGWMASFQGMVNALEKMASAGTIDEFKKYQNDYEKYSKTFDYMRATRGGIKERKDSLKE